MKPLISFIFLVFFANTAFAGECNDLDTLFDATESFSCLNDSGNKVCINFGYHDTVQQDGMRIFEVVNNAVGDGDYMIFNDPAPFACFFSFGFKACTHQWVKETKNGYKAYRKRNPDVWDARKSETNFELDAITGIAEKTGKGWDVNGDLVSETTETYSSCVLEL
ncbi:MAG: hypothetical protein KDD33_02425 [Bdellovibrionales bacterium]|nr:hypothetical protein [Bdellovibrionales bacterium]